VGFEEGNVTIPILISESPMTDWRMRKMEVSTLILAHNAVFHSLLML
jgi:hypothetical protein